MTNQNIQLNIGDKIGFVRLAADVDGADIVTFYPVAEICERDGERAYRYEFPNGEKSSAAVRSSDLASHVIRFERLPGDAMICLSDRRDEFKAALKRSFENDLEVFADWDRDSFVVVNKTKKTEYPVKLETINGLVYASCGCKDFEYRRHVCKHIAETLSYTMFSTGAAA